MDWPEHAKQTPLHSYEELEKILLETDSSKHIFVEFYTLGCKFCYMFMEDYN